MAELKPTFGRRQSALNTASTALTFSVTLIAGVFFTPFLLSRIGPESYGLIMLAAVVVSYGSPLVQTLSTTLARELAFVRPEDDPARLKALFDRAMSLCLRLVAWLGLALLLLTLIGPWLLGVSQPFRGEASGILFLTGLAFLAWALTAPFGAILYVTNRLDLTNHGQLAQAVVRILGAVLFIEAISSSSLAVPIATLAGGLVAMAWAWWCSTSISPLRVSLRGAIHSRPLNLRGTGAAVLLSTIAIALLLSTPLPLVSHLTDERATGSYAASIQIAVLARSALLSLSVVFGPQIMAYYSEGDVAGARREAIDALRWLGIIAALPAGIVMAAAPMILGIWLGSPYADYATVLRFEIVSSVLLVAALPMHTLALCADRVGWPSIIRALSAICQIGLALALFHFTTLGLASVAAALTMVLILADFLFMALYSAHITGAPRTAFLAPYVAIAAFTALAAGMSGLVLMVWTPRTLVELVVFGGIIGAAYLPIAIALFGREHIRFVITKFRGVGPAQADQPATFNPEQLHP